MLKNISALSLLISMIACGTPPVSSTVETNDLVNANTEEVQTQTRQLVSNPDEELTCMQQCGQEARGTIFADCLNEGGDRKECGTTGREWYRECLMSRCDEADVQFDNCRTDCRADGKSEQVQCIDEGKSETNCIEQRKAMIQSCIDEC